MCNHDDSIKLDAMSFSDKLNETETKLTLVEIWYCNTCKQNFDRRETAIQTQANKHFLPVWTFKNHKKTIDHV